MKMSAVQIPPGARIFSIIFLRLSLSSASLNRSLNDYSKRLLSCAAMTKASLLQTE